MTKTVYFVIGEESGDLLGADLIDGLETIADLEAQYVGLAGHAMQKRGMRSLFEIEGIAVMGFSAVIARLPTIIRRVHQVVADIVAKKPDIIVLIDSPDFTHAVAKRVRKKLPSVPIVDYVCPSVWAWRSGRAKTMRAYIDHVLAILPFEPKVLAQLDGPPATYVGHRLARHVAALPEHKAAHNSVTQLLVLPGSRRGEIERLLPAFGETVELLRQRGHEFETTLAAVPRHRALIERHTATWSAAPTIVSSEENDTTFAHVDVALAASGTVALELALHGVPMVTGYKLDPVARPFASLVTTWSALLPNLIADRLIVPEEINELVLPGRLARHIEELMLDGPARRRQLDGFTDVRLAMETKTPPGERAASVVFDMLRGETPS
ncbi:MAG: lipid-A-disaccharide synthase [Pseudomonadota bacterium]